MRLLGKILLKGLALLYFAMAAVGFLGCWGIEKYSASIFAFFHNFMGKYAVLLPVVCLIFTVVCWQLSRSRKDADKDDWEDIDAMEDVELDPFSTIEEAMNQNKADHYVKGRTLDYTKDYREETGGREQQRQERSFGLWHKLHNKPVPEPKPAARRENNGFSSYFNGTLTISENRQTDEKQFDNLGTNFSTYFGQGEKNIYLPAKTVDLQGFRDYFRDRGSVVKEYDQAANDTPRAVPFNQVQIRDRRPETPVVNPPYIEEPFTYEREGFPEKRMIPEVRITPENKVIPENKIIPENILARERKIASANNGHAENKAPAGPQMSMEKPRQGWKLPGLELLHPLDKTENKPEASNPKFLEEVLSTFGVTAKVIHISNGPLTTRYELSPAPGTKISKIVNLADDIALAMASRDIRIEAPIPGKAAVGIEVPRKNPRTVFFREVIDTESFRSAKGRLKVALGKDIADNAIIGELERMPHLLVAGATGSGKSIFINCLINTLLYTVTPDQVKFMLIDPKMVELSQYNGIPHLLTPVVTDPKKANKYLQYIVREMENRYELFAASGVRDIDHYNLAAGLQKLPYIVVIIDELADLMMVASNEIEESICRLAQMARAAGIHLVIATQRPSVNVITGLIKANIPSRISFAVSSQIDSRTILDTSGAEKLLGRGDMLYSPIGLNKPQRVHGCFIDEQEVKKVIEHWKRQGQPEFGINEEELEATSGPEKKEEELDDRFLEAGKLVIASKIASVSFLQRRLRVGYSRAARLMDMLEEAGVVGRSEGSKPREILMSMETFEQSYS